MYTIKKFKTLNVKFSVDTGTSDQIKNVGNILNYFIRMKLTGDLKTNYYINEEGFKFDLRYLVLEVMFIYIFFIYIFIYFLYVSAITRS